MKVRAQISMEFMTLLGILLAMLVIFSLQAYFRTAELNVIAVRNAGESVCRELAFELNTAGAVGDGYEHYFVLPAKLNYGTEYSMEVDAGNGVVRANWSNGQCALPIVVAEVLGEPSNGPNSIQNQGGVIVFG